jgi:uncharacterized protein
MKKLAFVMIITLVMMGGVGFAAEKINLAVITGGHDFQPEFWTLFADEQFNVTRLEHPNANKIFADGSAQTFDAIVLYDMYQQISEEEKLGFIQYAKSGKGLIVLHHAIASYQDWPEYANIAGGLYILNEKGMEIDGKHYPASKYKHDETIPVTVANPNHPITKGLPAKFDLFDEWYGIVYIHTDVKPLLETTHPDSMPILAWTKKYGDGEVCLIQCGHDKHSFLDKNFRQLISNAIRWAAE